MAPTRREILKLAMGTSAWLAWSGCRRGQARPSEAKGPRYFVQLFLSGGHDPIYTTDPKERAEVAADVDLPEDNRITATERLRLGVHFAPLEPWARDMAILNGVQLGTANHDTGFKQFTRLKTNVSSRMPAALDIIGQKRDTQPLGVAYMNVSHRVLHSPGYIGYADKFYFGPDNIFDRAAHAGPENLRRLARVMRKELASLERAGVSSPAAAATADNYRQVAGFFDRVAEIEPFTPPVRVQDYTSQTMSESLDRTLWLLENDLSRCVMIDLGLLGWDTHIANGPRQTDMNTGFVTHFSRFMEELGKRRNAHGLLADQTVIIAGSDMGRFPKLNDMRGKDHLPQTSFFFYGPAFAGGVAFGGTDELMKARPLSIATGKTDKGNHVPILDDVGATVLHVAGLDPERYGYTGKVLDFLIDTSA
jgi:hypothetical protein